MYYICTAAFIAVKGWCTNPQAGKPSGEGITNKYQSMEKKNRQVIIIRKARPRGFTNVCRSQSRDTIFDTAIKEFLAGNLPDAVALSAMEFSTLYRIPYQMVAARIKDGLASELLQGGDIKKTLEEERLKLLSSSLYRIGDSDLQLQRLVSHLARRVAQNPKAWPDLIKELNSAIGNQIKLTETGFKAITLLNQALATVPEDSLEITEKDLTRDQILTVIDKAHPEQDFSQYLEQTPIISPHNLGTGKRTTKSLKIAESHEFNKAQEIDPVKIHQEITVTPR